jgi:hypothetical protein
MQNCWGDATRQKADARNQKNRFQQMILGPLLIAACLFGQAHGVSQGLGTVQSVGFAYQPNYSLNEEICGPARPYYPQPGDIVLPTDHNMFWTVGHNLALAGHPHHSGIVITLPDGRPAMLEAGPHDTARCEVLVLMTNLKCYEQKGPVWIRRRSTPLTSEQSVHLTDFALAEDGKRFAIIRLAGQLTLLRSRGPIRTKYVGGPHGDRPSYFCSELVTEACVAAGLLAPETTRPSATYPSDLFFDRSRNLFLSRKFRLAPDWEPPARWTSEPKSRDNTGEVGS